MIRFARRVSASMVLAMACSQSWAAGFSCEGPVGTVGLNASGVLWVAYGSLPLQAICSVTGSLNGTTPESCRGWNALLLAAQAQDKSVRIFYDSATSPNPSACAGFQLEQTYAPYFIHTLD